MYTEMIKISEDHNSKAQLIEALQPAIDVLKSGGTVVIPTETVYGLAADALSENAVGKIYEAKGRPSDNPLIIHISDRTMLDTLVVGVSEIAEKLMEAFWPGPLTLIFNKRKAVPLKTTGGLNTVAVRMPSHEVARLLIEVSRVPIAAPSANLSGKPSPTEPKHVIEDMMGRVDCIISAGVSEVGLESTVVDITGEVPMILRPGAITREMIVEVVGTCELDPALGERSENQVARAPGMKYRHYAPEANVSVLTGDTMRVIERMLGAIESHIKEKKKLACLLFEEDYTVLKHLLLSKKNNLDFEEGLKNYVVFFIEGSKRNPEIFAKQLFRDLRKCDETACVDVLVHGIEEIGIGDAIMNRLKKSAEGRVEKL